MVVVMVVNFFRIGRGSGIEYYEREATDCELHDHTVSSSRFASTEFEFEFELEQQLRFKGRQLKQARSDLQQMQDLQQALILLQG